MGIMIPRDSLRLEVALLALSLLIFLSGFTTAAVQERTNIIVCFKDQPDASLVKDAGGEVHRVYTLIPAIHVSLPEKALAALQANPAIRYIEPNTEIHALGQTLPWGVDRIDADIVHASNKGAGINVSVLDTGIDYTHPDLVDNYRGGIDYAYGDGDPKDDNGHGTHVAGTIAAVDNYIGVTGVAPEASIYAVKVLDADGDGYYSDLISGIQWAVDNDMKVISISIGGEYYSTALKDACDAALASGLLIVASAGNDGDGNPGNEDTYNYPAAYESVIAVGATDSGDQLAEFSTSASYLELSAPGVSINSTMPTYDVTKTTGPWGYSKNYDQISGTSMACPHVSGTAALIWAKNPTLTNTQVRNILQTTAIDLGTAGRDNGYGYGLIDAEAAIAATPNDPPTITNPSPANGATDVPVSTTDLSFTLTDPEGLTMNYTVTTDPDIGSGSGNGVSDGTYSIPVSGLSYGTTYTWTVTPDDGVNTHAQQTYTFTTEAAPNDPPTITNPNPTNRTTGLCLSTTSLVFTLTDPEGLTMNYTVTTDPDIGTGSGTNVGSGMYSTSISGLEYGTEYTWTVTPDDGVNTHAQQTYTFTTELEPDPAVTPLFSGISPYYDNRRFAMIVSGDDWATWTREAFGDVCGNLTDRGIWFSAGIITSGVTDSLWSEIQEKVDAGYVEPCCHTVNHPHPPYDNCEYEINGSKQHILGNLSMPPTMTAGGQEYLYCFIQPYGESDAAVRAELGECDYLADRTWIGYEDYIYPYNAWTFGEESGGTYDVWNFTEWNETDGLYDICGFTTYIPDKYGGTDPQYLDAAFDQAYTEGAVYQTFLHPGAAYDLDGFYSHMDHCAWNASCWYTGLGQAYLYHHGQSQGFVTCSRAGTGIDSVFTVSIDPAQHDTYGFSYPLTYEFDLPVEWGAGYSVEVRRSLSDPWQDLGERTSGEYHNGVECFRIDYLNHKAYVSLAFDPDSDQAQIRFIPPIISDPVPADGAVDVPISTASLSFTLTHTEGLTMDYTVTTSPDIGTGSEIGVSDGTYSIPVSGLSHETTYTWTVTAHDGINIPTEQTYTFTTEPGHTIFSDGFESGDFSAWSGARTSTGASADVADTLPHTGTYSGIYSSDGDDTWERTYSYIAVAPMSEVYARGYVYVDQPGITDNGDRFYFIALGNGAGCAGWNMQGGVVRWHLLIRDRFGWVGALSSSSPSLNTWYSVELHWVSDSTNGYAELYVDGVLVLSISGKNTAALGDVNEIRLGLTEIYSCGPTTVYGDDFALSSNYIGTDQLPTIYRLTMAS